MSQSPGPSSPSEAPTPQELAEPDGHNPLPTRKADLLLKPHRELRVLGLPYCSREKEISLTCTGLTLVSTLTVAAFTQRLPWAGQEFSVTMLQQYKNSLGQSTGPGSSAAFQADKKLWKQTEASPRFPSKCCMGGTMSCLK